MVYRQPGHCSRNLAAETESDLKDDVVYLFGGVDLGSVSVGAVVTDESGKVWGSFVTDTGADPVASGETCLNEALSRATKALAPRLPKLVYTVATGYGRVSFPMADSTKTEISCQARGIHAEFPSARTVLDIGGQDAKVIRISEQGRVLDFAMNDKCAAGTGRFLEVMSKALEVDLSILGEVAQSADHEEQVSSTCTVFAESEVIGLIARKKEISAIAKGVHRGVTKRFAALALRVGVVPPVVLTGGVAKNVAVVNMIVEELGISSDELFIPASPQTTCATGAALFARDAFLRK